MLPEQQRERLAEIAALAAERDESIRQVLGRIREARACIREARAVGGDEQLTELATVGQDLRDGIEDVRRPLGDAQDRAAPPIAFVHIPKTAGCTVTNMFALAYSRAAVVEIGHYVKNPDKAASKMIRHRLNGARVAAGRIPYGLFREHVPEDARYVTFLREPVDRVLSYYFRRIHRTGTPLDEKRPVTTDSLEEALEMRLFAIDNLTTRFLCGSPSPTGDLPASALDDAKANLRGFAFVGLMERFDESVVLMQRALGLEIVPYEDGRVDVERPPNLEDRHPDFEEISDEQRTLVREHNRLDVELYAYAQELFDEALADAGDDLADDVRTLRDLTTRLAHEELRRLREWLDRELPIGSTKPFTDLRPAALKAGLSLPAMRRAPRLLGVETELDEDGGWIWTRSAEGTVPRGFQVDAVDGWGYVTGRTANR